MPPARERSSPRLVRGTRPTAGDSPVPPPCRGIGNRHDETVRSAPQPCFSGQKEGYLAHLSAGGALLDATYVLGGINYENDGFALASDGSVYLAACQNLAQVRFGGVGFAAPACITPSVLNAASQIAAVFDGVAAPVLYAQSRQVNAEAPFGIPGNTVVTVKYNGTTFGPFSVPVTFADPEILRQQIGVSAQALAFNQDSTVNGASNPARGRQSRGRHGDRQCRRRAGTIRRQRADAPVRHRADQHDGSSECIARVLCDRIAGANGELYRARFDRFDDRREIEDVG